MFLRMSDGHSLGFVVFYLLRKSSKYGLNLILWKAIFERLSSCPFGHVLGGFKNGFVRLSGGHSLGFVIFYLLRKWSKICSFGDQFEMLSNGSILHVVKRGYTWLVGLYVFRRFSRGGF